MASCTKKLSDTITWAQANNFGRPLISGSSLEPALTSANTIKATILAPPFSWRWNRTLLTSITTQAAMQSYTQAVPTFGWIESASVQDPTSQRWYEVNPKLYLARDSSQARPLNICAYCDDGAGNITFRFMPVPDKAYGTEIATQNKAVLFASLTDLWSPIPDEYQHIYNWGFLALMFLFADDPRFQLANSKFVASLLAANEGLTETQINIFRNTWAGITDQLQKPAVQQQGIQARGM